MPVRNKHSKRMNTRQPARHERTRRVQGHGLGIHRRLLLGHLRLRRLLRHSGSAQQGAPAARRYSYRAAAGGSGVAAGQCPTRHYGYMDDKRHSETRLKKRRRCQGGKAFQGNRTRPPFPGPFALVAARSAEEAARQQSQPRKAGMANSASITSDKNRSTVGHLIGRD